MKQIWILTKREMFFNFNSLLAYFVIILFLGFSGFFTWLYGSDVFLIKQATLQVLFDIAYWTLFFFIPAITMRMFAEENFSGTIELLVTKPITDWQIVMGKFLSALLLIIIALALTLPYYFTVTHLAEPKTGVDHGAILMGYLGLILMSGAYISIGLFASSITNNQIVSFLLALCIGIFFHLLFAMAATGTEGWLSSVFNFLNLRTHYDSMARGVIDSKDIIYFGSIIFVSLSACELKLAKRNIVN